jgi:hypothetical protein
VRTEDRVSKSERRYWLDRSENVSLLYRAAWVIGVFLLLADLWIHRHEGFGFAELFGFHGVYGFVACVALVLAAKGLRRVLMRPEDYYDR